MKFKYDVLIIFNIILFFYFFIIMIMIGKYSKKIVIAKLLVWLNGNLIVLDPR